MSLYTRYVIACAGCDYVHFLRSSTGPSAVHSEWVYSSGSSILFPLLRRRGWCQECNTITLHEHIPTDIEIDKYVHEKEEALAKVESGEWSWYGKASVEHAKAVVRGRRAWHKWRDTRNDGRCLVCASSHVVAIEPSMLDECKGQLPFPHPGCGGALRLGTDEQGMHFNGPRINPEDPIDYHYYSISGFPIGSELKRAEDQLESKYPGLLRDLRTAVVEVASARAAIGADLSLPSYPNPSERPALARAMFDLVRRELADTLPEPGGKDALPAKFPEVHQLASALVRNIVHGLLGERSTGWADSHAKSSPERQLPETALHRTPFAILGATARDDRRRIVELAEEKSLELDHDACQKARSDLTSPRARLSAEVAWLPGVSPRKALQLIQTLQQHPSSMRKEAGLPTLAHLNLLAAAFEAVDVGHDVEDLALFIREVASLAEELSVDDVMRDINEDRAVSGFPEVRSPDQVEEELSERKRYYRTAIKDALNRLEADALVRVMTDAVDGATGGGEEHAPELLDALVDSYEVETQRFLRAEAENAHKLIDTVRGAAPSGEAAVRPYVDKLVGVARNWDKIAQPIQVSAKARGIGHDASRDLALAIRSLAVDLFNKHDMLVQSQRLTDLLQELFSEVPDVSDRVAEDADALAAIAQGRSDASAIDPIRALCEEVFKSIERSPGLASQEGQRLLNEGQRILKASAIKPTSPVYRDAKDMMAIGLMRCAVAYGNETAKWAPCISLLESALELASDSDLKNKLTENLKIVRANHASLGDLEPIKKAPSLSTINGIGVTLYGSTDQNPADGSYVATYYFVFFFIPIFPIARYRVIPTGGGYRFLGKGPLRTFDKWHIAISLGLLAYLFLHG